MLPIEVFDDEVVGLSSGRGKDVVDLRMHLAAGQAERMWSNGRLELLPKVTGAARVFGYLEELATGNGARLGDGEVAVDLVSQFRRNALEHW